MATSNNEYRKLFTPESLLDQISKKLYALKGVLNSNDFDFKKSKGNIIESIESIQSYVSTLQEGLKEK